jgi:hypothetical protein
MAADNFAFDFQDIDETDPLRALLAIEKRLRSELAGEDAQAAWKYCQAIEHAFMLFEIPLFVSLPNDPDSNEIWETFHSITSEVGKKKIDAFHQQFINKSIIQFDASWREKIHSCIAIIRGVVEREQMETSLREKILSRLNSLAEAVDRQRATTQKFADVLVSLCEGVSRGAEALTPAVRLFERVVGAIERLRGTKSEPLALPKPVILA